MTNVVHWTASEQLGHKDICSDTSIQVRVFSVSCQQEDLCCKWAKQLRLPPCPHLSLSLTDDELLTCIVHVHCAASTSTNIAFVQVTLEVPGWMNFIPRGAVENLGSKAMQGVLNTMVPRFLAQLHKDYARWAAGDESRSPVSTGQI